MNSTRSTGGRNRRFGKRKKHQTSGPVALEQKASARDGFVLETDDGKGDSKASGLYGCPSTTSTKAPRVRLFAPSNNSSQSVATKRTTSTRGAGSKSTARKSITSSIPSRYANTGHAQVHIVCAISENVAKETCVASLDAGAPTSLHVVKQNNGQTYAETLAYLDILQPDEILLNEGRRNSHLAQKILSLYGLAAAGHSGGAQNKSHHRNYFDKKGPAIDTPTAPIDMSGPCATSTVVKFVPRSFFDQTKGAELLRRVARTDSYDASVVEEYILLSSSYAVLQYTQLCLGATLAKHCLHLMVNAGGKSRMSIDRASLLHLELLANAKTGKMANSLIGTIDATKTSVGGRMLRSNIMAPPTDIDTINTRLDLVDSLIGDEEFFYSTMEHLTALPDVNRMLAGVALSPWKKEKKGDDTGISPRIASKGISALVCIKSVLSSLPAFVNVLEDQLRILTGNQEGTEQQRSPGEDTITDESTLLIGLGEGNSTDRRSIKSHHLLRAIIFVMRKPELGEILQAVNDVFTESTTYATKADAMKHQECFALKPKTDGMLDVMRNTFLANVDDIYRIADEIAEQHDMRVTVKHSTARGYFLAVPGEVGADLPEIFIQPVKSGRFINCSTEEIQSLNSRAQSNVQDLLLMTHEHCQDLLDYARERYDSLASLSDAIALLDMCHSFADTIASSRETWTRPVVRGSQDLTIRNGRYCVEVSSGKSPGETQFVPNHTYAPGHRNFVVLTGCNGSGKSTYLRQLAIIVVLAHCGSYVPAEKAIVPIRDRLCTRIGDGDAPESNISTFLLEMKETAFICRNAGERALILIDELGRATSNEDGVAIAWAVCEYLRAKQGTSFFVTHYPQLTKLADVYPGIFNMHMGAKLSGDGGVLYSHTIQNGPCQMSSDYGVEISQSCGWPEDVVASAKKIREEVETLLPDASAPIVQSSNAQDTRSTCRVITELSKQLGNLAHVEEESKLRNQLAALRETLVSTSDMVSMCRILAGEYPHSPTNLQTPTGTSPNKMESDEESDDDDSSNSSLSSSSLDSMEQGSV